MAPVFPTTEPKSNLRRRPERRSCLHTGMTIMWSGSSANSAGSITVTGTRMVSGVPIAGLITPPGIIRISIISGILVNRSQKRCVGSIESGRNYTRRNWRLRQENAVRQNNTGSRTSLLRPRFQTCIGRSAEYVLMRCLARSSILVCWGKTTRSQSGVQNRTERKRE